MRRTALLIVDAQNDFLGNDNGLPHFLGGEKAALPVKGAIADMDRLSDHIDREGEDIDEIYGTIDTHPRLHIGHARYWVDRDGNHPKPFADITLGDIANGVWGPNRTAGVTITTKRLLTYFKVVGKQTIWPDHCIDGSWGHAVYSHLDYSLRMWEAHKGKKVTYIRKGMNPNTEQYGIFEAAVPDPDDTSTQFNNELLQKLADADRVLIAGEALDFCVKASVEQIASKLPHKTLEKFTLLLNCMSPVDIDGKNTVGRAFLKDMQNRGMLVGHV